MHASRLWEGLLITLQLTLISGILAFIVAVILGLMAGSTRKLVRFPARILLEFFRGTSLPVPLMWLFFVLPSFRPSLGAVLRGPFSLALTLGDFVAAAVLG